MNGMARQRSRRPARLRRPRALVAATAGTVLLLACAEHLVLGRIVVELLLRPAQIAG
jgi:hypothetical protein